MRLEREWETRLELPQVLPHGPSNLFRHPELKSSIIRGGESEKLFLAVVQKSSVLSILHTISRSMKQPVCSKCSTCPCPCLKLLKVVEEGKKRGREEEDEDEREREEVQLPWSRKRQKKDPVHNFEDTVKQAVWYHEYGCNTTPILFPISRDPSRSKAWLDRLGGNAFKPPTEGLYAEPNVGATCDSHGNLFSKEFKVKTSSHIIIYNAEAEKVYESPTYACGTGSCRCLLQLDGDPFQLWHIRKGCFIEYTYIHSYILRHLSSGIPVNAEFNARSHALASLGLQTSLTVTEFQHAVAGFRALLSFPPDAFTCPRCSKHPRYLVFDGTDLGPAQKKVSHLTELEKPGDGDPLPQGGYFEDRTFMASYPERELVCNLLTGELDLGDFCEATFRTEEGIQVKELVQRLHRTIGSISPGYKRFLGNVCKETSVAGLLQVTCKEPLKILKRFCQGDLDITKIRNSASLKCLQEEIPPFLDMLEQIRKEEKTDILPQDVSTIVLTLLRIRSRTFTFAERRENSDYTEYDGLGDHPTAFYPDFPLRTYPQTYTTRYPSHTS